MALPPVLKGQSVQLPDVKTYAQIPQIIDVPNLIQSQIQSWDWIKAEGLTEVYQEISPIADYTGNKYELHFLEHYFRDPKYSPQQSKEREITYSQPLYVKTRLVMKETGEIKEQEIFMGDIPMMTNNGTFIINGAERVVVSQLVRSPGIYFVLERNAISNRNLCSAKLIPSRGAWLEFETSSKDIISVKVDRKRKVSASTFLRALGVADDDDMMKLFSDIDTDETHNYMQTTLDKDPILEPKDLNFKEDDLRSLWEWLHEDKDFDGDAARRIAAAQIEFYRRLRPGEPPSLENSRTLIRNLFFGPRRYDLGRVGRYKLNRRLGQATNNDLMTLSLDDVVSVIRTMIRINQGEGRPDDIDHLGNRRVRAVGELVQNQVRVGLLRMERMVKEKMTLVDPEAAAPQGLVNIRPVVAAVREFFGGSQLSQFMDQTNPLAELTHKRRLSALGPGGLSRERAGFDVRDVHFSHYGRICPIETPEGPNIGLLSSLASFARINPYGFIESPYRKVFKTLTNDSDDLKGRTVTQAVLDSDGKTIVGKGRAIGANKMNALKQLPKNTVINVQPFVAARDDEVIYLSADQEEDFYVAQANAELDRLNQFVQDRVELRVGEEYTQEAADLIDYMDVSPMQIMSVSAALIPFLEHDDANRALMGSNMQRQAVPLLRPQAPTVGTGIESRVARDSGQLVLSEVAGVVTSVTGREIIVTDEDGEEHTHPVIKFSRTNQGTCFDQRPIATKGDVVDVGSVLADSSSTDHGELALGQNVLVAFMSWEGYNYEDAIIVSERLYRDDYFTSIHIEKHEMEARETKLGPEEITRDIPNVGETSLRDLDEFGIIRVGADVGPGDILVGKVTPKGETELTAEEKLLRAIFGEKSRDVKDTSLRVPHGERGKVIDVKVLTRENRDDLSPGVNEAVRVWIAQTRKISVGDKMAGRHGNKGVVARILPEEDMPYMADGTPVDIILNPIGVPSRMNLGQVLETHLGWAARGLNFRANTPVFDGAGDPAIEDALARVWFTEQAGATSIGPADGSPEVDYPQVDRWLEEKGYNPREIFDETKFGAAQEACLRMWLTDEAGVEAKEMSLDEMRRTAIDVHRERRIAPPTFGKFELSDGRTGENFDQLVTVGSIYILKLIHLVEDKIHARSTGPYSMITQQPLGGKAQFGGQRFGEMEVWALEAYSAAYNLQEVLTVKSDDVAGRVKTYEAIVKGEPIGQPGVPESFNVLLKELQSLGLAVELLDEEKRPPMSQNISDETDLFQALETI
ncbi:MAG: DNA-directed RNA polymerase subunit beta [SAR202 cluster bacterium]|jgi:DNA-directed RNA polymerase subunit beta|nr:DNA-directed RNA polymerase subunit beta [Dehalococcoidia bacterium]MQF88492.1 DNA-directed RNA polymerase subunit beta [SAR202 cluster bacterium]|tara:strand:- start:8381 stop:12157 length:3777 start_codon:yes stop_codon:yes gene_type:complete